MSPKNLWNMTMAYFRISHNIFHLFQTNIFEREKLFGQCIPGAAEKFLDFKVLNAFFKERKKDDRKEVFFISWWSDFNKHMNYLARHRKCLVI